MLRRLSYTYSTTDRNILMSHLKDKGERLPKNWELIHSEVCKSDELKFDVRPLLTRLGKKHGFSKDYFRIDIVSNPDSDSALDFGEFRVRYRYGIANDHIGEQLIQDNTREFCSSLVRAKKIYRREDISIMSFRGANPIAKRNYSIFNLKGHWNCRHAWIREIFVIEKDPSETENNPIVEKTTLSIMENAKIKEALAKFKESTKGEEFSKEDIIAINKDLLGKQKFVDIKVDDKILRIDGELEEGNSVAWIDGDEVNEVPNGEITLVDEKKVLTITDGMISKIVDVEEETKEEETKEENLSAEAIGKVVAEQLSVALKPLNDKFTAIDERLDKLPAFGKKGTKNSFKEEEKEEKEDTPKKRVNVNSKFSNPRDKKED